MTFPKQVAVAVRPMDGRNNRRFLIRPPPVAENAVFLPPKETDGRIEGRTGGRAESHGNGTRTESEKCYLFAGDNNAAATATAFFFSFPFPPSANAKIPPDPL